MTQNFEQIYHFITPWTDTQGTGLIKLALKTTPANVYELIWSITLNSENERINKCHLKKDIHDYLRWATKLTRMMPRGFELIPQF